MRIQQSGYSISQILGMLTRRELVVNDEYQRGSGFWPNTAMTYLIDTILNDFPIPKLFFFERVDVETRKTKIEIIDGQQRISTIRAFADDKFRLGSLSETFEGLTFSELEEEHKRKFLGYPIQVDVILQATEQEVLEMFRRMNSYTTPLNNAEKRHAEHNGPFKWFVNQMADEYSEFFVEYGVVTKKQSIRMADAEMITDLVVFLEEGIVNQSPAKMRALYEKFDKAFDKENEYTTALGETFTFVSDNFSTLAKSPMFKGYSFYTLVAALMYNKRLTDVLDEQTFGAPSGKFVHDAEDAVRGLSRLSYAHGQKDVEGEYGEYVLACIETTHRVRQRSNRVLWQLRALNGEI